MAWARTAVKSTLLVNQLCSLEPMSPFAMADGVMVRLRRGTRAARRAEDELGLAVQLATLPWLGFVPDDCQFLIA
jgi:hypothetical protein